MKISSPPGSTPIDPEALAQLIPNLITQEDLNEFEAANIARAMNWAYKSKTLKSDFLSVGNIRLLHEKMFDETWEWAGKFRRKETSIGVDPAIIQNSLGILLGDAKYWLEHKTFPMDEIAVRFHHRLVKIHPFVNGNGRLSRLAADLLMEFNGETRFTWGMHSLVEASANRTLYLKCLRVADKTGDVKALLEFAKS